MAAVVIATGFGWETWGSWHPLGWDHCRDKFGKSSDVQGDCWMFREPSVSPSVCRGVRGWSVTSRCLLDRRHSTH